MMLAGAVFHHIDRVIILRSKIEVREVWPRARRLGVRLKFIFVLSFPTLVYCVSEIFAIVTCYLCRGSEMFLWL